MRDHIRREALAQDLSSAWFIVPMAVAAAVLIAVATMGNGVEAETTTVAPAVTATPAAPEAAKPTQALDPLPEAIGHVQAF